jgi:DNA-binding NarL/FixJ family response regulator
MKPEALILSADRELSHVLRAAVERFGIVADAGPENHNSLDQLETNKFDLVVVDCSDLERGCAALRGVRQHGTHHSAVSIAIVEGQENIQRASDAGADYVVSHANYEIEIASTLRSAYGLILRERGRYSRFPLVAKAQLRSESASAEAWILNVSQGGVCVRGVNQPLSGTIELRFALEEQKASIEVSGTAVWQRDGEVGIQFTSISKADRRDLEDWLARQFEIQTLVRPAAYARSASQAAASSDTRAASLPNSGDLHPVVTAIIRGGPVRARCSECRADIPFGGSVGDSIEQERKLREAFAVHVRDKHRSTSAT